MFYTFWGTFGEHLGTGNPKERQRKNEEKTKTKLRKPKGAPTKNAQENQRTPKPKGKPKENQRRVPYEIPRTKLKEHLQNHRTPKGHQRKLKGKSKENQRRVPYEIPRTTQRTSTETALFFVGAREARERATRAERYGLDRLRAALTVTAVKVP